MVASKYGVHNTFASANDGFEGMDMSMCLILTFAALISTILACGLLLCCIRLSTDRDVRRSAAEATSTVENDNSATVATPMLHRKVTPAPDVVRKV